MGKLELDQTFSAREEVNEILLRDLDIATDPWGVKVLRVEVRDITPSKAVLDSMELQMAAERKKRAAILTSEGERDAAVNSAQGHAEAQVLEAEAQKKAAILRAEAQAQQEVLKAQAAARSIDILAEKIRQDPQALQALQYILTQGYLEMGVNIGQSASSKVMFLDPNNIVATLEGMQNVIGQARQP
jgi:regulator of protease activity HflC (stomatin/prohibitin superfamily)